MNPSLSQQSVEPGALLLADPSLRDGIFNKSVILLADHNDEGSMGFILNQPTGKKVGDFLNGEEFAPLTRIPVHAGGPVAKEQLTFGSLWWDKEGRLGWSVRISAQEAIEQTKRPGVLVRAFVGYSGWSAGQLNDEMEQNSWLVAKATRELLAREHDESLWAETLSPISAYHYLLTLCPAEPWLN
ncbi:MAG: YqgE/AlgH family protein [Verrucomicrobiota bacterium JB023]|nr:YqgE/AlgH family protein [Verrucomicrobiota bacterium JB023]